MQVALAWLLQRSPNILLIPGTSSLQHLHENLAAAQLTLPPEALAILDNLSPAPDFRLLRIDIRRSLLLNICLELP